MLLQQFQQHILWEVYNLLIALQNFNANSHKLYYNIHYSYPLLLQINLLMNIQKNELTEETQIKCKNCKTFFACQAFQGHCSSCYKKLKKEEQVNPKSPNQTIASPTFNETQLIQKMEEFSLDDKKKQQTDKKRCFACNKKVGLLGIQCKCGYIHCNSHRLPQNHECEFNHQAVGKQQLKKQIIKVYNGKITQI